MKPNLPGVKLHCKSSRIPQGFRATTLVDNSGETDNDRCLNSRGSQEISTCKVRYIMGDLKEPLCTGSPSMDNTFWDPLPIKLRKFFHQMIVFKENWTCKPETEFKCSFSTLFVYGEKKNTRKGDQQNSTFSNMM